MSEETQRLSQSHSLFRN